MKSNHNIHPPGKLLLGLSLKLDVIFIIVAHVREDGGVALLDADFLPRRKVIKMEEPVVDSSTSYFTDPCTGISPAVVEVSSSKTVSVGSTARTRPLQKMVSTC